MTNTNATTATANAPNLTGRTARCTHYGGRKAQGSYSSSSCKAGRNASSCMCEESSSPDLAFFEYQGDGSRNASICKHCGMSEAPHQRGVCPPGGLRKHRAGTTYEAQGDVGYDKFYCGCWSIC